MIETEQNVTIAAPIADVWAYVRDIAGWASLMPGLQDCSVIDENDSLWTLKVGAGGLVRTVKVRVHVDEWDGPGRVVFTYGLERDPVEGGGTYTAIARGARETEVTLQVRVKGSGPMAPMWEALGKPLLPQFARSFAGQLRDRIEATQPVMISPAASEGAKPRIRWSQCIARWFGRKGETI
ncbi:MAG TPA: SRPBCC family protein [Sphingobium sp.]|uniref:CoxG family protein n=1 Tax=Sphingobium sp. TaxID=1912891 RepID=UPI002ED27B2C